MASATSTSTQDVITAIVTNGIVCAIFVTLFLCLRLRFKRIYEPKSSCDILPEDERPEKLPLTPILWIKALLTKKPSFIIKYSGVDGYLFLRYLLIVSSFGLGGIFTFIVLLPVNATGGNGETGLNQLSFSNNKAAGRYYAHVFVSWIYYGAIMFTIYRELHFYVTLKNMLLSTPYYATKLSSRVVIFQTVPNQYINEHEFFKLFDGVKQIHVAKTCKALTNKINERASLVSKLENSLNKIIKKAVKIKIKKDKKNEPIELENELVSYIPQKKMPVFKEKFLIGKKHDLIEYCKERIPKLNEEIRKLQNGEEIEYDPKNDKKFFGKDEYKVKKLNSIAVEFENQYYAQLAYQVMVHDQPLHFEPKHIGVEANDIFWPNIRIFWWEKLSRISIAVAVIFILIIIWAIPVAFVGLISNLTYLTNKLKGLRFIYKLPKELLGLITSLLPTILLSILMMFLPIIIRSMAKLSGCLTNQSIEYFTQQSYFAFQVVQTFLVVTIASSVTSVVTQIIEEPTSALSLLSTNLPKSSNFFISYIILNGFSISGGILFQIVNFILFYVMSYILDKTVRSKFTRYNTLGTMAWGTTYPVYEVLTIISLAYSIISPLISLFTFVSFLMLYLAYMNTLNYINGIGTDMMGKNYPRALFHLMVGIYLGEICLIGLFAVSKTWGCIILEVIFLGGTVLFHVQMNIAFDKLIKILPNTFMRPLDGESETVSWKNPKVRGDDDDNDNEKSPFINNDKINEPLIIEGSDFNESEENNLILRYIQPWKFVNYRDLKDYIPESYWVSFADEEDEKGIDYECPDLRAKCPTVWIPCDPMGLSKIQIAQFEGIVPMTDGNNYFNDKGEIVVTGGCPEVELGDSVEKEDPFGTPKR